MVSNISVRLAPEELAAVDALIPALVQQAQGARISRASVLKAVIAKGVAAMQAELGLSTDKKH